MTGPAIGVTLGDPGGIGPEIVLKALAAGSASAGARVVIFGERGCLERAGRETGIDLVPEAWNRTAGGRSGLFLEDIPRAGKREPEREPSKENGLASFAYFEAGLEAAEGGLIDALVTAPISKSSWNLAGIPWRGHTEVLESHHPGAIMSFWSKHLRVALFSHHVTLKEAIRRVRQADLLAFFLALDSAMVKTGRKSVEYLVAGLNPHAGEGGILGTEEEEEILPAIEAAKKEGIRVSGPYPPDTIFLRARETNLIVALYHDQGLIAFKSAAFRKGVNVTLGLPFPRTSPDHGTAFDIAGRGTADPGSMIEALRLASAFSAPGA